MAPRKTRASTTSAKQADLAEVVGPAPPQRDERPLKLFVLPEAALGPQARFVTLQSPAGEGSCRFLYGANGSFYELTKVGHRRDCERSALLVSASEGSSPSEPTAISTDEIDAYVLQDAVIHIATPFDPLFFLSSLLLRSQIDVERDRPVAPRTMETLLNDVAKSSDHMQYLLRFPSVRETFTSRLREMSELAPVMGDEAFRPDPLLFLDLLHEKALRLTKTAWPASMERSVQRQLEAPAAESTVMEDSNPPTASPALAEKLRLRVALQFILASYVPQRLRDHLEKMLASGQIIDFTDLDAHLNRVKQLHSEIQAFRSLSNNVSRKRKDIEAEMDGDGSDAKRAKGAKDEPKAVESRATKELKKVNTSGMRKMSSFFAPKQAKTS